MYLARQVYLENYLENVVTTQPPLSPAAMPPVAMPTVAVVILNWHASDDTLACLRQLATWQAVTPHVWVVDNASGEAEVAALRKELSELPYPCTLLENPTNDGFAGGTNRGLTAALAAGDWPILLLNNDAQVNDCDVAQMLATLTRQPDSDFTIGIVGPLLYHGDKLLSAGSRNPVLHHHTLLTQVPDAPIFAPIFAVDYISGSVALIRADLLRQVGLLDEDYFFNTEIADLCHRARQAGYTTVVDAHARAQHNLDRSSARRSTLYTYYIVRNRLLYARKRYAGSVGWLLFGLWTLYSLLLVAKLRLQGQRSPAQAVYLAVADGWAGRWGGQNARVLAACGQWQLGNAKPVSDTRP